MKKNSNYRENNFSNKFDNYTLRDLLNIRTIKEERLLLFKEWEEIGLSSICAGEHYGYYLKDFYHLIPSVKPERYMWHLSRDYNRGSIIKHGLNKDIKKREGIWAHNRIRKLNWFYPMIWDAGYFEYDLCDFDYWRIDTHLIDVKWRLDPYMYDLQMYYNRREWSNASSYLVTLENIPANSLKLYQFPKELYKICKDNDKFTISDLVAIT